MYLRLFHIHLLTYSDVGCLDQKLEGKRNVTLTRIKLRTGNVLHFILNFISDQTLGPEPYTTLLSFHNTKTS